MQNELARSRDTYRRKSTDVSLQGRGSGDEKEERGPAIQPVTVDDSDDNDKDVDWSVN